MAEVQDAKAEPELEADSSNEASYADTESYQEVVAEADVSTAGGGTTRRLCDPFLDRYATMMDHENIANILAEQEHMLTTLEVANEKISSLNQISERNYQSQAEEFRQNIRMLGNMKKELDSVFRRIRSLKSRLAMQYPKAYSVAEAKYRLQIDDESEEVE